MTISSTKEHFHSSPNGTSGSYQDFITDGGVNTIKPPKPRNAKKAFPHRQGFSSVSAERFYDSLLEGIDDLDTILNKSDLFCDDVKFDIGRLCAVKIVSRVIYQVNEYPEVEDMVTEILQRLDDFYHDCRHDMRYPESMGARSIRRNVESFFGLT